MPPQNTLNRLVNVHFRFKKKHCMRMSTRRFCSTVAAVAEKTVEKKSTVRRLVDYGKGIADDYKTVAKETWQDMKESPIKSTIYISLITGIGVLFKTRPSEQEFYTQLTENSTVLMLVGSYIRNPKSEKVVVNYAKLANENRLTFYNFGICTILCEKQHPKNLGLYAATCKYVNPHWTELHRTIIDVGVFGRWVNLDEAMKDYDINPEEWLKDGQPNKEFMFYKEQSLVSWDMKIN